MALICLTILTGTKSITIGRGVIRQIFNNQYYILLYIYFFSIINYNNTLPLVLDQLYISSASAKRDDILSVYGRMGILKKNIKRNY